MITAYYDGLLLLSLILLVIYVYMWHKHFDVHITILYVLVPLINLGYSLLAHAETLEEALAANKLIYLGGCFGQLMILLVIFGLCDLKLNRWIKTGMIALSLVVYCMSLTVGKSDIYYRSVTFERIEGAGILHKEYGPMHAVFIGMIVLYFVLSVVAMIYSYFRKNQVSKKLIAIMFVPVAVAITVFFVFRNIHNLELLPAIYILVLINDLMIVNRLALYDVSDNAIDSLVRKGDTGFISFDNELHYLGSNDTAKQIFPVLNELTVDRKATWNETAKNTFLKWIDQYRKNSEENTTLYSSFGKVYLVTIRELFDGRRNRGYQLFITDDTPNQNYIQLLNHFNDDLKQKVEEKTKHIVEMHDNLILSMATMVESRDNSTGGHIRRTSEGVRILTDVIQKDNPYGRDESFYRNLIKAAPMHDLGKIAVDDAVLRKPGRFTPEEFEKMKCHAAEGARIVHDILKGTDDAAFKIIAENVAHYHHERWDGSGYPNGLRGEGIPLEARIMAIADVYDALVSKRVYKDKLSFEKADSIIMEGMGSQFDPGLKSYYVTARPVLEAYYQSLGNE